jgi:RNA polymerase sigma-70 factor (ECF subfamily)
MVIDYRNSIRIAEKAYSEASEEDKEIIGRMIRDMRYAVRWLKTGRDPGSHYMNAERNRLYPSDPLTLDAVRHEVLHKAPKGDLSQAEKEQIEDVLCELTEKERQVYILAIGELYSYGKIAELLEISKGTVQSYMERANKKIEIRKLTSIFCINM